MNIYFFSLYINIYYIYVFICADIHLWISGPGFQLWLLAPGLCFLISGSQLLASSFWLPAIWLPANGFWLLVSGYWLPGDIPIFEFMGTP